MNKSVLNNITGWLVAAMALSYGSITAAETVAGDMRQSRSVMVINPTPETQAQTQSLLESAIPTQAPPLSLAPKTTDILPKLAVPRSHILGDTIVLGDRIAITNIDSWLLSGADNDGDGYYQNFTLAFNVRIFDLSAASLLTYPVVYMSFNGGRWEPFQTDTRAFAGERRIELSSQLDKGYPTGDYDFKVELYEVGYQSDILLDSLGPQNAALNGLPLEDGIKDQVYDVINTSGSSNTTSSRYDDTTYGGAMEWFSLVGVLGFMLGRRYCFHSNVNRQ